jgi:hypothetical protein
MGALAIPNARQMIKYTKEENGVDSDVKAELYRRLEEMSGCFVATV